MLHYYQVGKLGKNILEEVGWERCICLKHMKSRERVFQVRETARAKAKGELFQSMENKSAF